MNTLSDQIKWGHGQELEDNNWINVKDVKESMRLLMNDFVMLGIKPEDVQMIFSQRIGDKLC